MHPKIGYNFRMTDIQCAIGLTQLKKFDSIVEKSNSAFQTIKSRLTPSEGFKKRLSELNPFKDVSFEGLRTSLAEIDIFGGLREKLANFKLPELKLPEMPDISKLVEDQMNEIFSFFKFL